MHHARDNDQTSFNDGQSSLMGHSAFRRYEESPKPAVENPSFQKADSSRKRSKKAQRIGKITVKTRESRIMQIENN